MFLLPPPEGLEDAFSNAYSKLTSSANSLFDAIGLTPLLDATNLDPATMTVLGSLVGSPASLSPSTSSIAMKAASPRIGILSRYKALRDSPFWDTMSREEQLRTLRGVNEPRTPQLEQALKKTPGRVSWKNQRLGWLDELLKNLQD